MEREALERLFESAGLNIVFNPNGVCMLSVENRFDVSLEYDDVGPRLHVCSGVYPVPNDPEKQAEIFKILLEANAFGRGTGKGYFALDGVNDEILLVGSMDLNGFTVDQFLQVLEEYTDVLRYWTTKLASGIEPMDTLRLSLAEAVP
ncbi:MAG: type III secretion system chaperone [Puniceicoccales bacterium]|jgi:hypothetical protein|nr:type III secretion system chaperone [Puniceicoccales bacterium]